MSRSAHRYQKNNNKFDGGRKDRKARNNAQVKQGYGEVVPFSPPQAEKIEYLTNNQRLLHSTILANDLTFALGPAGTGKSHIPLAVAVIDILARRKKYLILTKPNFEVDEELGILPGDLMEKAERLFKPMIVILKKLLGASRYEMWLKSGKIVVEPIGGVVGNTYDDAYIIVDEAQNTTPGQMKAILTRVGTNTKIVVIGDAVEQRYLQGRFGLDDAIWRFDGEPDVGSVTFTEDDIVRSGFCRTAVLAYRKKHPSQAFESKGEMAPEPGILEAAE